jgi:hypothetical protein
MTELAVIEDRPGTLGLASDRMDLAMDRLIKWAEAAAVAEKVAEWLVRTSFVPAAFRGKPQEATAAILAGAEVGLNPTASLRSFDIIQGVAAARANTLRAIVQSHGHDIWVVESTEMKCIVRGKRKGSEIVHESVWDENRARRMGLLGKDNWQKGQKGMLVARATAECCRLTASDAILGIPYSSEELWDGEEYIETAASEATEQPVARRVARRKPVQQAPVIAEPRIELPAANVPLVSDNETIVDAQPVSSPPAASGEPTIRDDQFKAIQDLFKAAGITEPPAKQAYCVNVLQHPVASLKTLTAFDADKVLEALRADAEDAWLAKQDPADDVAAPVGGAR